MCGRWRAIHRYAIQCKSKCCILATTFVKVTLAAALTANVRLGVMRQSMHCTKPVIFSVRCCNIWMAISKKSPQYTTHHGIVFGSINIALFYYLLLFISIFHIFLISLKTLLWHTPAFCMWVVYTFLSFRPQFHPFEPFHLIFFNFISLFLSRSWYPPF